MGKRLSRLSLSDFIEILKHSWTISSTISNVATCRNLLLKSKHAWSMSHVVLKATLLSELCLSPWGSTIHVRLTASSLGMKNRETWIPVSFKIFCQTWGISKMQWICISYACIMPWHRHVREGKALCHDKDSARSRALSLGKMSWTQHIPLVLYTVPYTVGSLGPGKLWVCGWFWYFLIFVLTLWYGMVRCNLFMHSLQCSDLAGLFPRRVEIFFTSRHVVKIQINIINEKIDS